MPERELGLASIRTAQLRKYRDLHPNQVVLGKAYAETGFETDFYKIYKQRNFLLESAVTSREVFSTAVSLSHAHAPSCGGREKKKDC